MRHWRLFNALTRQQIVDLEASAAYQTVLSSPQSEREHWFVWRPGYADWMRAIDCIEIAETTQAPSTPQPPPVPSPVEKAPDRRKHSRHSVRLKIVVVSESKTFRAHTKDISEGGLLLEKKVPWSLPGQVCLVYISEEHGGDSIGFKARILSSHSDPFRLCFEECDEKFQSKLQKWIEAAKKKFASAA